jgi:hypothetical protein
MAKANKRTSTRRPDRMVTFEISTLRPLRVGQQVFIAGDLAALGGWQPDGFPLTRLDDNLWSGYLLVPEGRAVEFKITRGTWASEEADPPGVARAANHVLPEHGNTTFRHTVNAWRDRG